jgi:hypothetical protein
MTEQLCFDCNKEKATYDAKREVHEEYGYVWKDVKVCKECKVKEQLQKLSYDYSFYYHDRSVSIDNIIYNFNLKKARLIFIEYDKTNDTFVVHIEYTRSHKFIIVYDFDLNPVIVV